MTKATLSSNVLKIPLEQDLLDYAAYIRVKDAAEEVQNTSSLRGLVLVINSQGDNLGDMGDVPGEYVHRIPKGDHGAGPIIQQDALNALWTCMKPTAAFLGEKVGGSSIDLASFCDTRVASDSTILQDDRITLGQTASTGITYLLPRLIGLSQAMRLLLMGGSFNADALLNLQFVHEIVPDCNWQSRIEAMCDEISKMPTRAYEVHKMQVLPQLDISHDAAMIHSLGIRQTHVIKDRQEGIQAWRERRAPRFTGE